MATLASFTASPNPVPSGQNQTTLSVSFNLSPANPDKSGSADLHDPSGAVVGTLNVVFTGTPAESEPVVQVGPAAGEWSLQIDQGTLVALGSNDFRWTI